MFEKTYYVDNLGYLVLYSPGENELGYISKREIYWHFNGFMLLGVF